MEQGSRLDACRPFQNVDPRVAGVLYFSKAFPMDRHRALSQYLRLQHVGLAEIGLVNTIGLAWTLKLLWAPRVDVYGTYRRRIACAVFVGYPSWFWLSVALGVPALLLLPRIRAQIEEPLQTEVLAP